MHKDGMHNNADTPASPATSRADLAGASTGSDSDTKEGNPIQIVADVVIVEAPAPAPAVYTEKLSAGPVSVEASGSSPWSAFGFAVMAGGVLLGALGAGALLYRPRWPWRP